MALTSLEASNETDHLHTAAQALRRACLDGGRREVRGAIGKLLRHWTGQEIVIQEQRGQNMLDQYRPWFDYLTTRFPDLVNAQNAAGSPTATRRS